MTPVEVLTRLRIRAAPAAVWEGLLFYEQIDRRPPWLLRLLLPQPLGTEGAKDSVGDEALCRYDRGHLLKRVTVLDPPRYYAFDVAEQQLPIALGIRLSHGSYTLRPLPDGATELAVLTRYTAGSALARGLRRVVDAVCHRFHRHLLEAIRRRVEGG